ATSTIGEPAFLSTIPRTLSGSTISRAGLQRPISNGAPRAGVASTEKVLIASGARASSAGSITAQINVAKLRVKRPAARSKRIHGAELEYPRVRGAGDFAKGGGSQSQAGIPQIRVVREVEKLRANLDPVPFRDGKRLVNGQIPDHRSGAEECAVA